MSLSERTSEVWPLHCQVAALDELQPVLNRQPVHRPSRLCASVPTWRLTHHGADVRQRGAAPLAAGCKNALQCPQFAILTGQLEQLLGAVPAGVQQPCNTPTALLQSHDGRFLGKCR